MPGAMTQNLLGQFEHQVLLAILRQGSESYSVDVVLELERCTDREVADSVGAEAGDIDDDEPVPVQANDPVESVEEIGC